MLAGPSFYHARSLATTPSRRAALAERLLSKPTVVLHTPSPEYIEREELSIELLPVNQVNLVITDRAAEVRSIRSDHYLDSMFIGPTSN
jgi:hypothetical protein